VKSVTAEKQCENISASNNGVINNGANGENGVIIIGGGIEKAGQRININMKGEKRKAAGSALALAGLSAAAASMA
jgi:hypothetical protein